MKSLLNALQEGRLIELPDTDKQSSLEYLAHLIEAIPDLAQPKDLMEAVLAREKAQNTGLGLGVACPHVRAAGNGELFCAVGWSPVGIDYGAPDGQKVHLVVMYYIPDSEKGTYLKEVSALAGAVRREGGIKSLALAQDITTVRERLLDWVSAAIDANIPETKARIIRLEARQAAVEAAQVQVSVSEEQALDIQTIRILTSLDAKPIVLAQNAELAKRLEDDDALPALVQSHKQFDRAGYRLVFRSAVSYGAQRTLHDYLALRINGTK
jgi:mannitol/fructose-specific phosphotransferase system IIA component (Ntr-type)